jgi:hypothetical protein
MTATISAFVGVFVGNLTKDFVNTVFFVPNFFVPIILLAGFVFNTGKRVKHIQKLKKF